MALGENEFNISGLWDPSLDWSTWLGVYTVLFPPWQQKGFLSAEVKRAWSLTLCSHWASADLQLRSFWHGRSFCWSLSHCSAVITVIRSICLRFFSPCSHFWLHLLIGAAPLPIPQHTPTPNQKSQIQKQLNKNIQISPEDHCKHFHLSSQFQFMLWAFSAQTFSSSSAFLWICRIFCFVPSWFFLVPFVCAPPTLTGVGGLLRFLYILSLSVCVFPVCQFWF